jgi:hypothetical protein
VKIFSKLFYADAALQAGASLVVGAAHEERAIYLVEGGVEIGEQAFDAGRLLIFSAGDEVAVKAKSPARVLLLGGEPMDGPRHIWWNFVSSSRERIEQAKADWKAQRFLPVPGDTETIPLPE